jgi:hypothetical protein
MLGFAVMFVRMDGCGPEARCVLGEGLGGLREGRWVAGRVVIAGGLELDVGHTHTQGAQAEGTVVAYVGEWAQGGAVMAPWRVVS